MCGIGLFNGRLQCVEGKEFFDVMRFLEGPVIVPGRGVIRAWDDPAPFLENLHVMYSRGSRGYVTQTYDDPDDRYDENGIYVGDDVAGLSVDKDMTLEEELDEKLGE